MFQVYVHDDVNKQLPKDDIFFIVGKEGQFIKKKVGVLECLVPVEGISTLASVKDLVQSYAKMHIKKMSKNEFTQIFNFFRAVYKKFSSESTVLLFYHEKDEKYFVYAPKQEVSGASVDYKRTYTKKGYTMIGTIHSHANFSAFHSGTDHDDESSFDGLHITVGNVADDEFSLSASIMANGHRVMVNPEEYISGIKLVRDIDELQKIPKTKTYIWDPKTNKMVEDTSKPNYLIKRRFDKRYSIVNPINDLSFPDSWLANVEKKVWGTGYWNRTQQALWEDDDWFKNFREGRIWGPKFDYLKTKQKQTKIPPTNVGPQKTPGIVFPKHEPTKEDKIREIMFWTINELFKHYDVWERENETAYYCRKCDEIYEWDEVNEDYLCKICNAPLEEVEMEEETKGNFGENLSESGYSVEEILDTIITSAKAKESSKKVEKRLRCGNCMAIISREDYVCPYCNTTLYENFSTEAEMEKINRDDTGEMLSKEAEEIEKQILADAAKRDESIEKIPDPEKNEMPLSTRIQKTSRLSIKEMLRRRFGRPD